MSEKCMVSIIIPVYNMERYVDRCLCSAIKQTYPTLEILVMDGKSTDSSLAHVMGWQKKDSRIHVISRKDGGLGPARNDGVAIAQGEYILFLDSDDWLANDYVEKAMKYHDASPDFVMTGFIGYDDETGREQYHRTSWLDGVYDTAKEGGRFLVYGNNSMWGKLIHREWYEQLAVCQPMGFYEDLTVYPTLVSGSAKIAVVNHADIYYRTNRKGSLTRDTESYKYFSHVYVGAKERLKKAGTYEEYKNAFHWMMYRKMKQIYQQCGKEDILEHFSGEAETFLREKYASKEKTTYWVYGGFGLRWSVHRMMNGKEGLKEHFVFTGLISQMSKAYPISAIHCLNSFRQHCIESDLQKSLRVKLENKDDLPDYFLIDFMQEDSDVYEVTHDRYITDSEVLRQNIFLIPNLQKIGTEDALYWKIWKDSCSRFCKLLRKTFSDDKIILVRNYYTSVYQQEEVMRRYPDDVMKKNEILDQMYDFFEELMPKVQVLHIPNEINYTDMRGQDYKPAPEYGNAFLYDYIAQNLELCMISK